MSELIKKQRSKAAAGELPNHNIRGICAAARHLTARLDARFGFNPTAFRRKPKTQAA